MHDLLAGLMGLRKRKSMRTSVGHAPVVSKPGPIGTMLRESAHFDSLTGHLENSGIIDELRSFFDESLGTEDVPKDLSQRPEESKSAARCEITPIRWEAFAFCHLVCMAALVQYASI